MSGDFLPRCNVTGRCKQTARWAVQVPGYGRCACTAHKGKAIESARRHWLGAEPKTWPLGVFEERPVQLELPIEEE